MVNATLEQVWQLVEQLSPRDRDTLMSRLQARSSYKIARPITLASIMAEREHRLATGESKSGLPSLRNAYADPDFDVSEEQLRDSIKGFGKEWEQELDLDQPED